MPERIPILRPKGQVAQRKAYESSDTRAADKRFYASARWLRLRRVKLRADPLCDPCEARGEVTLAQHVHHRVPRKQRPDLGLDYDNLESICLPCHNALAER